MSTEFINDQWRLPNAWNGTESNVNKQSNYSMDFDGSNNYISVTTSPITGNDARTMSFWYKTTSSSAMIPFSIGNPSSLYVANSQFAYCINNGSTTQAAVFAGVTNDVTPITGVPATNDGDWHHVVVSWSGSVLSLHIDGASYSTPQPAGNYNTTAGFKMGGWANNDRKFNGQLDGVSIFDYALSSSQITTLYGSSSTGIGNPMSLSPKPVAYYNLGDKSAFNGANYLVPNASLKDFVFNQNGLQLVTITGNSTTQPTGDYSLSIWVKIVGSGSYSGVLNATSSENANGVSFLYNYSTNNFQFYQSSFSNDLTFAGSTNTWQNIIISYNNTTGDLIAYLNGQQADSNTITPSAVNWVVDWQLNNYRQTASPLYGQNEFSNFQIFNTALSASDAETLYNNGSPLTSMSGFISLQGWWKLDASATYDSSTTTWTIPDSSSNSNDGTSSGMTQANLIQSDLSFTSGYSPYALDFDGADDKINLNSTVNLSNSWSVSFWFKTPATTSYNMTVFKGNSTNNEGDWSFFRYFGVHYGKSTKFSTRLTSGGSSSWVALTPNILDNLWHNLVITYNYSSSEYKVYLDGSQCFSGVYDTSTGNTFEKIGNNEANWYWYGLLSNISIWNTSLTSSQANEIYSEGVPQNLNNHSAYSNLTNWWQLGSNSSFNTNWTVLDEKGSNNGTSSTMTEDDIVDGVGSYANGLSSGMGGDEVIGDAPYSTANALSVNMDVLDRVEDTPA